MDYEDIDTQRVEGGQYCIADELLDNNLVSESKMDRCGSSDAMSTYENILSDGTVFYTAYCFSCSQKFGKKHFSNSSWAAEFGVEPASGKILEKKEFKRKPKAVRITNIEAREVIGYGNKGRGCRGIKDKYREFFGHRIRNGSDGRPKVIFYPETQEDGKLYGYKTRTLPKYFGYENKGITGIKSELAGQFKFKDQHFRDIVICAGEEDMVAFFQQFDEYQERRNAKTGSEYTPMPVVSPTTGEGSAYKQLQAQYDFINRAETIFIGMDNDAAGRAAAAEVATLFPKDKVKIINWSLKDPNNAIRKDPKYNPEGKDYSAQTIRDFYEAKDYVEDGVFSSGGLMEHIKEALQLQRITLPSYMKGLQDKSMGSGLIKNRIYNIIGVTSSGKSTHINSCVHHFAFLPNEKTAVISLEATKGEYGIDILSLHLEKNLYWEKEDEVLDYLDSPEVVEKANNLFVNEYGEDRFYVVDDRKGTVSSLEALCERLRSKYGVTIIVIDVLTDLLRVTSNEDQASHLNWQSNFVKNGVTIFNVLHTRKLSPSKDLIPTKATEMDAYGSSIFIQKAAGNFVINRNKECPNEDWIERNTTYVDVAKLRQGETGQTEAWYYDPDTRQCYARDKFFKDNPTKLPQGYDLSVSSFDKAYYEEGGRGYAAGQRIESKFSNKAGGKGRHKKEDSPEDDLYDGVPL